MRQLFQRIKSVVVSPSCVQVLSSQFFLLNAQIFTLICLKIGKRSTVQQDLPPKICSTVHMHCTTRRSFNKCEQDQISLKIKCGIINRKKCNVNINSPAHDIYLFQILLTFCIFVLYLHSIVGKTMQKYLSQNVEIYSGAA